MGRWIRAACAALIATGAVAADDAPPVVGDSGIVERARSSLALLDMTVIGPPDAIASLEPADFKIKVNLHRVHDFELDRYCSPADGASAGRGTALPVRYMLYFDQRQLTLLGRQRSIDLARQLVPLLAGDGNEVMIVSSAVKVAVLQEFTGDRALLLAALESLEHDREQWDVWATQEPERVASVVSLLNDTWDVNRAISAARRSHREERSRTERDLRRLAATMAWLGDVVEPKIVLYFADTVRSNAGEHYLTFFGRDMLEGHPLLSAMGADSLSAGLPFDAVVNEAASQGVRFYPVLGLGLAVLQDSLHPSAFALERTLTVPDSAWSRMRDVESTLDDLAAETGGKAFFHGESATAIADRIESDHSCLYVAAFDPQRHGEDAPMRVVVESLVPGVRVHARGRMVFRSEEARRTARLLGAFSLSDRGDDATVSLALVPTGYRDGAYSALLQVSVPGSVIPSTAWDIGASVVARDRVVGEASGRVSATRTGVPLVVEEELTLAPGTYEIVGVAHERQSDFVFSGDAELDLPDPDRGEASVLPVAVLQPVAGAFVREGDTRTRGSLAHVASDAIDRTRPTAFVGLVCRGRKQHEALVVERTLVGASSVAFPPVTLDGGEERCAQLRDVVPAKVLMPGHYRYEIRVVRDGRELSSIGRDMLVRQTPG
jgi:VWFA-related protein